MDIHKPKPVHSLREFLSEIAVVVCGIAIALTGEQVLELIHRRSEVAEARAGIRDEIAGNVGRVVYRLMVQPCIDQRIAEIGRLLDDAEATGALKRPTSLNVPPLWIMDTGRWNGASHAGRVSLLPSEEQDPYTFEYGSFDYFWEMEKGEQLAWARLRALETTRRLTGDGLLKLRQDLEEARYYNWSIREVAQLIVDKAKEMGVSPRITYKIDRRCPSMSEPERAEIQ